MHVVYQLDAAVVGLFGAWLTAALSGSEALIDEAARALGDVTTMVTSDGRDALTVIASLAAASAYCVDALCRAPTSYDLLRRRGAHALVMAASVGNHAFVAALFAAGASLDGTPHALAFVCAASAHVAFNDLVCRLAVRDRLVDVHVPALWHAVIAHNNGSLLASLLALVGAAPPSHWPAFVTALIGVAARQRRTRALRVLITHAAVPTHVLAEWRVDDGHANLMHWAVHGERAAHAGRKAAALVAALTTRLGVPCTDALLIKLTLCRDERGRLPIEIAVDSGNELAVRGLLCVMRATRRGRAQLRSAAVPMLRAAALAGAVAIVDVLAHDAIIAEHVRTTRGLVLVLCEQAVRECGAAADSAIVRWLSAAQRSLLVRSLHDKQ